VFQGTYIYWVLSGLVFLLIDKRFSNTLNLSSAYSLLLNSGVAFKNPGDIKLQILSFLSFWVLSYFLISTALKKEKRELENENNLGDYKNMQAVVYKDIGKKFSVDGIGRIKYEGMIFKAKSTDDKKIAAGQKVRIVSRCNKVFNVEVIKNAKN